MSWKEDIVKLNSPHSKLLYMIYYFSQLDSLSSEQATKLKEYVVLEDEKIFNILNEFDASADDLRLLEDMKQLYMQEVRFLQEKGQKMTAETRAGPLSETTSINAISGVGYKKQLSVNTERSFLNNAMSSINKRMTVKGDPEQEVGSPVAYSLFDKKKKKQDSKNAPKLKRSSTHLNIETKDNQSKFEMYQKSFLGMAVGNLV